MEETDVVVGLRLLDDGRDCPGALEGEAPSLAKMKWTSEEPGSSRSRADDNNKDTRQPGEGS